MSELKVPAVVLAGGAVHEALAEAAGLRYKALIPIEGRPMVARVVETLARAETISQVLVVGPPEVAEVLPQVRCVPGAASFFANLVAGVAACAGSPQCLLVSCDIPFITPEMMDALVRQAVACNADFVYPYVQLSLCEARFPGMHRTSVRVREGRVTGGNAMLIRPRLLQENATAIEAAYAARKAPLRVAGMLGWGLVLRMLLAQVRPAVLSMRHAERSVGRLIGGKAVAIEVPYPEIGADIDKPEDLARMPGVGV